MAEKEKRKRSGLLRTLGKLLVGEIYLVKQVEKKVDKTIHNAEKASIVLLFILTGLIFILVGLAQYFTFKYTLAEGLGFLYVGLALLFLGWFARLVKN